MKILDAVRRKIAAHACWWQEIPTFPRNPGAELSDDEREFADDMAYLADLETAVMDEMRSVVPRMFHAELRDMAARLALPREVLSQ